MDAVSVAVGQASEACGEAKQGKQAHGLAVVAPKL